jgi:serine/threonine protein kinase
MYNAPERHDRGTYTQKVDIWALGCVVYELCALQPAFDADSMESLKLNISGASYDPLPASYSQELRDIVDSMLCVEPEFRPSAGHLLRRSYLAQFVGKAASDSPPKAAPKGVPRRRPSKIHAAVFAEEDEAGLDEPATSHAKPDTQMAPPLPLRRGSKQLERLSPSVDFATAQKSRSPSPPRMQPWPADFGQQERRPHHLHSGLPLQRRYSMQLSAAAPPRLNERRMSVDNLATSSSIAGMQDEARQRRASVGQVSRSRSQPAVPVGQLRKLPPL